MKLRRLKRSSDSSSPWVPTVGIVVASRAFR
jgi:hypothetical protein